MQVFDPKLEFLSNALGFTDPLVMLQHMVFESVVPAICTNEDCDYYDDMEPDARDYTCPECKTKTLQGCLVIAEMI